MSFLISDDFIVTSAEPLDALGTTVKASIVAKFEHGYLLRVQVGREKLHGVLYHAPPPDIAYPLLPPRVNTTGLALQDGKVILKRAPKKKVVIRKEVLKRDRNAPRPARTGYNFFFSEARTRDQELNPGRDDQERSAAIGEQWRKMTAEDRQVGMGFSVLCFVVFELLEPKDEPDEECRDRRPMEAVKQPSAALKPASQPVSNGGRRKTVLDRGKVGMVGFPLFRSPFTEFVSHCIQFQYTESAGWMCLFGPMKNNAAQGR